jgi:cellulose synthase/poly-beta-1,6-N-acetylglucosamine synthase-like glycosyltransferase
LIAARNEAEGIAVCLESIFRADYPSQLLEVLVIDDFSTDATGTIVSNLTQLYPNQLRLLQLADHLDASHAFTANKKKAIALGIEQARSEMIITTDADCEMSQDWLRYMTSVLVEQPSVQVVAAPVLFYREKNLLQRFQALDFLGMMGVTGAGIFWRWHYMGNGANLAYRKSAFAAVGGYAGNEQIASGDDMFLINAIAKQDVNAVFFLKSREAIVRTEAKATWLEFWQQRLRWGTKNAAMPAPFLKLALLLVWLFCVAIVALAVSVFFDEKNLFFLLSLLFVKAVFDFLLLRELAYYFQRRDLLRWFFPSFFIHTLYIALAGTASIFFRKYTWKGRVVR